jgi:amino acid adenylation domain-containing protein
LTPPRPEALSPEERRELLLARRSRIPRVGRAGPLRLSFAQERLWLLDQLGEGGAYLLPHAFRVSGPLAVPALAEAFRGLVDRHEILRTTYELEGGEPVQVVHEELAPGLPVVDLTGLPPGAREVEASRITRAEADRPIDLARGPALRLRLLRLAPEEHLLLETVHHISRDGWSSGVFAREVEELYRAARSGDRPALEALEVQVADHAAWERRRIEAGELDAEARYWTEQLSGAPPLALPTDRPRPSAPRLLGAVVRRVVPADLADRLRGLARESGTTLFMVLLAAFQALLRRYTGQRDISVGTPVARRDRREVERLIGCFVNTLVLRVREPGDPRFLDLLSRVREACLGAYARQGYPFEKLVERLKPDRELGRHPLFQAMFLLATRGKTLPQAGLALEGTVVEEIVGDRRTSRFDLTLGVHDEGELRLWLEHSTELFDGETAARMLAAYARLLERVVEDPERRISELELLDEAERRRLLVEWNAVPEPRQTPPTRLLHELFEEQAARSPSREAVVACDGALTCAELDRRSKRLAWRLARLGVGPETVVGVCLDRTLDLPVAILGVLRAGGVYLPLDPELPPERLAYMLEDSGVRVLVTRTGLEDRLANRSGVERTTLRLDVAEEAADSERAGGRPAPPRLSGENLAYVMYTSGSTGRPKGVGVRHAGLACFGEGILERPGLRDGEVLVAVTTISFDISILELLLPLVAGARVVVASREEGSDPATLAALVERHAATAMQATPARWRMLLGNGWSGGEGFRILCGGEALPPELAASLLAGGAELWNLYGPTETTIWSSAREVRRGSPAADRATVSVGRPLPGQAFYILDDALALVPPGAAGELCIGGGALARGYLGRGDLTAERFVPDSFSAEAGGRLYRTGDLARHLSDGEVEILGRIDQQVKIRGFRIELGEIEAALVEGGGVREAVATMREVTPGDQRLVAYVVPERGSGDSGGLVEALARNLRRRLPEYMIPSAIVPLEALPLTPSGKVDRKALPVPDGHAFAAPGHEPVAPRDEAERRLSEIWAGVLGLERVGALDNFFELGGHSLLAMQVVARIWSTLGIALSLRTFFGAPTVERLARAIRGAGGDEAEDRGAPTIPRARRGAPLPLSHAQERLWFLHQLDGSTAYHLSAIRRIRGELDPRALARAVEEVARRHEVLRTTIGEIDGGPVQVVGAASSSPPALRLLDVERVVAANGPDAALEILRRCAAAPYDLSRGPLFRAIAARLAPRDHALLLGTHHIVSDGWSLGLLLREVSVLYEAFRTGRPSPLPELPVQYGDFAAWSRAARTERRAEEIEHWRTRLSGVARLDLPLDRPRQATGDTRGARATRTLGGGLADRLRALGHEARTTLFVVLLSAFKVLLGRLTGQEDVTVGSPFAHRDRVELEGMVGFFVNTIVLRTDLSGEPTFLELVERVRATTLDGLAHQGVHFEELVEALRPQRLLDRTPFFDLFFNLDNVGLPALEIAGTTVEPVAGDAGGASKFDATLYVGDHGGPLRLSLLYRTALFDGRRMETLLDQYAALLEQVVEDPGRPLHAYALRAGAVDLPDPVVRIEAQERPTVPELVDAVVAASPRAIAVRQGSSETTFEQLRLASDDLARALIAGGLRRGEVVAVVGPRCPGLICALLGVLRSGGVLLALDPRYPVERRRLMIERARARLLVQAGDAGASGLEGLSLPTLGVDRATGSTDPALPRDCTSGAAARRVSGTDPAYLFFTSGSTGTPKGVLGSHRGLSHFLDWERRELAVGPGDRTAQLTSLSFDVVLRDIFLPLTSGATLCLPDADADLGAESILPWLERERITLLHAVPTVVENWLASGPSRVGLSALRRILFAGEPLRPDLVERWRAAFPLSGEVVNLYGPTETTLAKFFYRVPAEVSAEGSLPVGFPLPGAQGLIVNRAGTLCGVGELGEVWIRTPYRSLGYLDAAPEDRARFVPNPFAPSGDDGDLVYRSGDLGRYRPDGAIVLAGRADDQVKVRGVRVEPGEVAAFLARQAGIETAAVVPAEDPRGGVALVAYVVAKAGADIDLRGVTDRAARHLLPEMLPAALIPLAALPLTPNGKLDRRALPPPDWSLVASRPPPVPPSGPLEEVVAAVWSEVLRLEPVGAQESFFELGGHSLLATRVLARVRQLFGVLLPLRTFFERPTVAGLARAIRESPIRPGVIDKVAKAWLLVRASRDASRAVPSGDHESSSDGKD